MGRARELTLVAIPALLIALVAPGTAQGSITIGSSLASAPTVPSGCIPGPCTIAPASLSPTLQAPGGLVSPVNGTVVTWRIRVGGDNSPVAFRVIRRLGGGLSTGAGTSSTVTPPLNKTSAYPTQLPIAIGETIGIDCCAPPNTNAVYLASTTGMLDLWNPGLADVDPGRPTNSTPPYELEVNADIEPTSAFTIVRTAAKKGGKLEITASLPNSGRLVAGDRGDTALASAAGKGKQVKYLKRASARVSAPGQATLVVKSTKAAHLLLAERGRLKAKLKLVFTPTGGTSSAQVSKVNLKR